MTKFGFWGIRDGEANNSRDAWLSNFSKGGEWAPRDDKSHPSPSPKWSPVNFKHWCVLLCMCILSLRLDKSSSTYNLYVYDYSELIPANNTVIRQLPADFYCRIVDGNGANVETQWYIDGILYTFFEGPIELVVLPGASTNLTLASTLQPLLMVSCRSSFYPDTSLGVFLVGK